MTCIGKVGLHWSFATRKRIGFHLMSLQVLVASCFVMFLNYFFHRRWRSCFWDREIFKIKVLFVCCLLYFLDLYLKVKSLNGFFDTYLICAIIIFLWVPATRPLFLLYYFDISGWSVSNIKYRIFFLVVRIRYILQSIWPCSCCAWSISSLSRMKRRLKRFHILNYRSY